MLVTHGIHWLPQVDHIVVLTDGQISEEGSYESLMSHEGAFANFLQDFFHKEEQSGNSELEEDEEGQYWQTEGSGGLRVGQIRTKC